MKRGLLLGFLLAVVAVTFVGAAEDYGLKAGSPELKSAGSLAFGPDGILFIADTKQAKIFAVNTKDTAGDPSEASFQIEGINTAIADMLGISPRELLINDLAVNPASGNVYLSVSRGRGPDAQPVILKVGHDNKISQVTLENVEYSQAALPNPPADALSGSGRRRRNPRLQSITDLQFTDGQLFIAGLSNEEFASTLRSVPFPFRKADEGTGIEIFHGAHGRFETRSPIRTFAAYEIEGDAHLLAAYTCTPLVKFKVSDLKPGVKVKGTTVAELGNRNQPLDMVVYSQEGKDYLLIANSSRGIMKVTTDNIDEIEGITERVGGGGTAGLKYETIEDWKGVVQLDKLNDGHAVLLVVDDSGSSTLKTVALP